MMISSMRDRQLPKKLQELLGKLHQEQVPIVLATGVFDLLHQAHICFLENGRKKANEIQGAFLVGVESDRRVKQLKGSDRPIENQAVRVANIKATGLADEVFVLPEHFSRPADHLSLIELIKPSVLVVSAGEPKIEEKRNIMFCVGGDVEIVCSHIPGVSTTRIINSQLKKNKSDNQI